VSHDKDESGNIPKQVPKEARELANFMALVVDETTNQSSYLQDHTNIRCFKKKCEGTISSEILKENNLIHWVCSKCKNEGTISHWQNTRWNNG